MYKKEDMEALLQVDKQMRSRIVGVERFDMQVNGSQNILSCFTGRLFFSYFNL